MEDIRLKGKAPSRSPGSHQLGFTIGDRTNHDSETKSLKSRFSIELSRKRLRRVPPTSISNRRTTASPCDFGSMVNIGSSRGRLATFRQ